MSRAGFWNRDWLLGLVVAVVLFLLGGTDLLQSLERKAHPPGVRATDRVPAERIAVIAIDDASVASIGRLPWHRDVRPANIRYEPSSDTVEVTAFGIARITDPLPFEGDSFLERALARDVEARFKTGVEFSAGLRAAASRRSDVAGVDISL